MIMIMITNFLTHSESIKITLACDHNVMNYFKCFALLFEEVINRLKDYQQAGVINQSIRIIFYLSLQGWHDIEVKGKIK